MVTIMAGHIQLLHAGDAVSAIAGTGTMVDMEGAEKRNAFRFPVDGGCLVAGCTYARGGYTIGCCILYMGVGSASEEGGLSRVGCYSIGSGVVTAGVAY